MFLLLVGIPALAIALGWVMVLAQYSGPQYDIVIWNDHAFGGFTDKLRTSLRDIKVAQHKETHAIKSLKPRGSAPR